MIDYYIYYTPWKKKHNAPENSPETQKRKQYYSKHPFSGANKIFPWLLHLLLFSHLNFQGLPLPCALAVHSPHLCRRQSSSATHGRGPQALAESAAQGIWRKGSFLGLDCPHCWWFRNPKQPPGMVLKPCKKKRDKVPTSTG